jgi:hypothetical protein
MSGKKVPEKGRCAYCGTQTPSGALYCPRCGEPIDSSSLYDEGIFSEGALVEEAEEPIKSYEMAPTPIIPSTPSNLVTKVLYKGMIRGSVTGGSIMPYSGTFFVMKLEENNGIAGIPDEILVRYNRRSYFRKGDKVILQGRILKTVLKEWGRPMYTLHADNFYNESLQIGREGLLERYQILHKGMIRGSVTGETTLRVSGQGNNVNLREVYFVIKLEEKLGTERLPDEILVHTLRFGYFGVGDKVILQGRILKTVLKKWGRPSYTIRADQFYNESLQIGWR